MRDAHPHYAHILSLILSKLQIPNGLFENIDKMLIFGFRRFGHHPINGVHVIVDVVSIRRIFGTGQRKRGQMRAESGSHIVQLLLQTPIVSALIDGVAGRERGKQQ